MLRGVPPRNEIRWPKRADAVSLSLGTEIARCAIASFLRRSGDSLVRIDEVLFAGGALAVGGNRVCLQRFGQRHGPRVLAGEGRLQPGRDALAQLLHRLEPDLLQERG